MSNLAQAKFFEFEGVLKSQFTESHEGHGLPNTGDAKLMAAPKGSSYRDVDSGITYVRVAVTGNASDWSKNLNKADYDALISAINSGGSANAALQGEVDAVEGAVGLQSDGTLGNAFLGTNYISGDTTITGALVAIDGQAKATADALVAEVTRATGIEAGLRTDVNGVTAGLAAEVSNRMTADQTEIDNRVSADTTLQAALTDQLNTETGARLAGDQAATTRMDGIQTELDATQVGAGLAANGAYVAATGSNYLDAATSLHNADNLLDSAIKAEKDRATGAEAALASAIANEQQRAETAETNLQNQIQAWVNVQLTNNANADLEEQAARIAGDQALTAEVNRIEAAVGLDADGNIIPITGTNYLNTATTVFGGAFILDTELKRVDDALAGEISTRTNAITTLQAALNTESQRAEGVEAGIQQELNTTQAGAGLETNGSYAAPTGSNYLNSSTSLKDADYRLDAQVKVVADAAAANQAAISSLNTTLTGLITAETNRAEAAEQSNATAITAEQTRAEGVEATLQAAITVADKKQTELAALVLSARKESSATNISAAAMVDEVATQQVEAAKWTLYIKGNGADAQKRTVMEVLAMHNGTATVDADAVDSTAYAKLRLGTLPSDLAITIELTGTGVNQRMQLKVASPTTPVDVYAVRERLPGLDLNSGNGGSDGNNWTPGTPDFLFGATSYTPNPDIVF